jgi:hypothetical protein
MTRTELMQAIIQKQDELIKIHVDYVIAHEMEGYDWNLNFKEPANKVIDELADLKKQLEECEKKDYSHLCCICHENYVDSDNGIDTCDSCMNRI